MNEWNGVTIDCIDPSRVATFWGSLLHREVSDVDRGFIYLGQRSDSLPRLVFQPVPEPKEGKSRIHLDVTVDDIDAGIAEVLQLGGSTTGQRHDYDAGVVVIMKDPEDNEFCLVQYY